MTVSPIASEEISLSPWLSSSRTILETAWSMRSGSTGRLRSAICIERSSLSRSNGTRRPLRLMTTSSRNCTRSNVVKRKLQVRHTRRRRMTEESSVGRESLTCVSRLPQFGQRMDAFPYRVHSLPAPVVGHPIITRAAVGRRGAHIASGAYWIVRFRGRSHRNVSSVVNRKSAYESPHLLAHGTFGYRILLNALVRERVEHLHDQLAHLLELGDAETAARPGGSAEAHPRRDRRLLRIERNAVLVAGDAGASKRQFGHFAGQPLGPQVNQHEMGIGAAGDDIETSRFERFRQCLGIRDHVAGVELEGWAQRFAECHSLGGDHMHQRPA